MTHSREDRPDRPQGHDGCPMAGAPCVCNPPLGPGQPPMFSKPRRAAGAA